MIGLQTKGCALVDDAGVLMGSISVSDVRAIASMSVGDANKWLDQPATVFLSLPGKDLHGRTPAGRHRAPITVCTHDTLSAAIEVMTTAHVHRLYIVDSAFVPIVRAASPRRCVISCC
jgi:hypothetical protein